MVLRAVHAAVAAAILHFAYILHTRAVPWASAIENRIDGRLQASTVLMVGCGALHSISLHAEPGGALSSIVVMLDVPISAVLYLVIVCMVAHAVWHLLRQLGVPQAAYFRAESLRVKIDVALFKWAFKRWRKRFGEPDEPDSGARDSDSDDDDDSDSMEPKRGRIGQRAAGTLPGSLGLGLNARQRWSILNRSVGKLLADPNATPRGQTNRNFTCRNSTNRFKDSSPTRTLRTRRINQTLEDRALAVQDLAERARCQRHIDREQDPRYNAAVERRRACLIKRGIDPDSRQGGPSMPTAAALPRPGKEVLKNLPQTCTRLPGAAMLPAPRLRERATRSDDADENERGYSLALPPRDGTLRNLKSAGERKESVFVIPTALPRPGQSFTEKKAPELVPEGAPAPAWARGPQEPTPRSATPRAARGTPRAARGTPRRKQGGSTPRAAAPRAAAPGPGAAAPRATAPRRSSEDEPMDEPPIAPRGAGACGRPPVLLQEQVNVTALAPAPAPVGASSSRGVDPPLEC